MKNKKWLVMMMVATVVAFAFGIVYKKAPTNQFLGIMNGREPLPIPPLLEDKNPASGQATFHLQAQKSTTSFLKGMETETYGYNGNYLGPVIKVRKGDQVSMKVKNELGDEQTTVHWHGLEVPGDADGGPHQPINPGEVWSPQFTIDQQAATLWYHPHQLHKTGEQVYKGLAGLFYIEDEVSDRLNIPKDYGKNDFPIVIQDKQLTDNGDIPYQLDMMDLMHGIQGNTILVNGAIDPYLEVPKGKVRLRLLNGSNARIYKFTLNDDRPFWQIGSDGGFLEKPVKMNKIILGPAERAEIIVDFGNDKVGQTIDLVDQEKNVMSFVVKDEVAKKTEIPSKLTDIERIDPADVTTTRSFTLQGMGPMVNINGKQMDMNRIDEEVPFDGTEIWEIKNSGMNHMMGRREMNGPNGMMGERGMSGPHPFHIHGVQFQVLERNGTVPPANEQGWKDTVLLFPNEEVKVIAQFKQKGTFMYHCHILEHEDAGMMGQFQVSD